MDNDDIGLFEAIYTMRSIRRFKPDPVPDDLLRKVLEAGSQAPSGGNRQPWRFFVLRSDASRAKVKALMQLASENSGLDPARSLLFADAPVVIIVCAVAAAPNPKYPVQSVGPFGQTYPAVENMMLAARGLGLGTCITTSFRFADAEFREWLQLPEELTTTCLMPLGYPLGTDGERHGKKTRQPIEEVTYEDRFGQHIVLA